MLHIEEANWIGPVPYEGKNTVAVEVLLREEPGVRCQAYLEKAGPDHYHLAGLVKMNRDYAVDWFDNDFHQAAVEVSDEWFNRADPQTNWAERDLFVEDILAVPGIREQLERYL